MLYFLESIILWYGLDFGNAQRGCTAQLATCGPDCSAHRDFTAAPGRMRDAPAPPVSHRRCAGTSRSSKSTHAAGCPARSRAPRRYPVHESRGCGAYLSSDISAMRSPLIASKPLPTHTPKPRIHILIVRLKPVAKRRSQHALRGARRATLEHVMLPIEEVCGVAWIKRKRFEAG